MNNIAAYIDQVADEPSRALEVCKELGIQYVVTSRLWSTDILNVKDDLLSEFRGQCEAHGLTIVAIDVERHAERVPLVVSYFKCPYVMYHEMPAAAHVFESVQYNYAPLVYFKPGIDNKSSRVKLVYDPVSYQQNELDKIWKSQDFIGIIVSDKDYTSGPKPFGIGQTNILTLSKSVQNKWLFIKPQLGRMYGSLNSREAIFRANFELLQQSLRR